MELIVCLNVFLSVIGIVLIYLFYSSLIRIRKASESMAQSLAVLADYVSEPTIAAAENDIE